MLPLDRNILGNVVHEAWIKWVQSQSQGKSSLRQDSVNSWTILYEELPENEKEANRQIGEAVLDFLLPVFFKTIERLENGDFYLEEDNCGNLSMDFNNSTDANINQK